MDAVLPGESFITSIRFLEKHGLDIRPFIPPLTRHEIKYDNLDVAIVFTMALMYNMAGASLTSLFWTHTSLRHARLGHQFCSRFFTSMCVVAVVFVPKGGWTSAFTKKSYTYD